MLSKGCVHVIGRAADWDEVLLRLGDYAEDQYRTDFRNQCSNRGQVRTVTLARLLTLHQHNPSAWQLHEGNSSEDQRCFGVNLDARS